MLKWDVWSESEEEWDKNVTKFPDYSIYQSIAWGKYRSEFGWQPHHLIATDNNRIISMAQVLIRKYFFGLTLIWVPGGPIGKLDCWNTAFTEKLKEISKSSFVYCRISPVREESQQTIDNIQLLGWRKPEFSLISGKSLSYNPLKDESVRLMEASQSWRHNLKRSHREKYGNKVTVWKSPNVNEMLSVYESMWNHKNIKGQLSRIELESIFNNFADRCIVVRCVDAQSNLIALRGALMFGSRAWDIFAAASPQARKVYASHLTFWTLINECAQRNVKWYDMGGVDPNGSKGVYNFKKGTGATELNYLGEWDWSSFKFLRKVVNYVIKYRSNGM